MKHYKLVEFLSSLNVKPPCTNAKPSRTNVKPPYWRLSGDGSAVVLRLWYAKAFMMFCEEAYFLFFFTKNYIQINSSYWSASEFCVLPLLVSKMAIIISHSQFVYVACVSILVFQTFDGTIYLVNEVFLEQSGTQCQYGTHKQYAIRKSLGTTVRRQCFVLCPCTYRLFDAMSPHFHSYADSCTTPLYSYSSLSATGNFLTSCCSFLQLFPSNSWSLNYICLRCKQMTNSTNVTPFILIYWWMNCIYRVGLEWPSC